MQADEMNKVLGFGEMREGYAVPVLNEREVRTSLPISGTQAVWVVVFFGVLALVGRELLRDPRDIVFLQATETPSPTPVAAPDAKPSADCTPPDWAVQIGHADKWKLHHNCK